MISDHDLPILPLKSNSADLRFLLAVLLVYRSNFHLLHWLVKGANFNTLHEQCKEYYEMLLDDADEVAEMLMRTGAKPVNYKEASDLLENCKEKDFKMLSSSTEYNSDECNVVSRDMLLDIKSIIELVLEDPIVQSKSCVGIKSQLEAMHNKYDLEARYKFYRRTM